MPRWNHWSTECVYREKWGVSSGTVWHYESKMKHREHTLKEQILSEDQRKTTEISKNSQLWNKAEKLGNC